MNAQAAALPRPDADEHVTSVVRQAIIDGKRSVFGYALIDRSGRPPSESRDQELIVYAQQLAGSRLLSDRRVLFMQCTLETLDSAALDALPPACVVLAVALPTAIDAAAVAPAAERLAEAKRRGFRIALGHQAMAPAWAPWLVHASFLLMDVNEVPAGLVAPMVVQARRQPGLQVIACGVETAAQHTAAESQGIALFQGNWFARPVAVANATLRPGQATILQLINLMRNERPVEEIEEVLKRDPALSLSLLRFVNSPAVGLRTEISSFRHAAMILGTKRLFRWAALLIAGTRVGAAPAVAHTAVVRGRLMETLAEGRLPQEQCDHAFVVGIFSLLDTMTGLPMPKVLEGITLPDTVTQALLHRQGALAPLLQLAEACERADDGVFARTTEALLMTEHEVNLAHLQALAWAEEFVS
jgi:EAL and modified HD-GYP domain-containing signal transduction protein